MRTRLNSKSSAVVESKSPKTVWRSRCERVEPLGVRGTATPTRLCLPYPPPLQRALEHREGERRADSWLGREPLLLSGEHPDQRRRDFVKLPGSRGASQL